MKISAQLYTVRMYTQTPEGIAETLKKVADIGYRHVQCSKLGPIDPQHLRDLLDENGLTCCVTHVDPERLLQDVDGVIAEHKILGCRDIGMSIMPERYRGSSEGITQLAADYTPVIRRINDAGFRFHYHNHDVEFMREGKRALLDLLLEAMPDANLLLCAFWAQVGGANPIDVIERYGNRIIHIHLKDMAYGKGCKDVGRCRIMTPVMEGNMNYPAIVRACQEHSAVEYVNVEQDECDGDPFDCLRVSYNNLKTLEGLE
ncbi:sugar phosphate isomerase/epimerase [Eubacteriales bacterium OttesenSCG-928-A19]|nr:sugar phosphate isomerase/epimerase [Eubacteriales bacterium OttesenSCG-928-A19]